uniref:TNFR-Cys domain-containing protein n=1 Tax=Macrostomum lignano TaxID=282301 RepID=A0A1I8JPV6_9PLAT
NRSPCPGTAGTPPAPEAGHAPSVCVLCGNCARAGPACRFNRIDSGIGGVARCLCEPAVRRACATCGVCADCVAAAWALHACVHPNRALPGSINLSTGGDGGSDLRRALSSGGGFDWTISRTQPSDARAITAAELSGPAVELCPRLSLQSASKPEVTFCRNQLIAQDELIVCLKDTSTSGLIQVYPEVNVLEKDLEFKSKPQSLDYSVDISFRLSPANLPEDLSLSDAQSSAEQMPRYNYSAKSNSYLWQDAGLLAYSCVGDRSSQLPVGLLIGQSPLTGGSDTFTITEGTISIGLVPFGYHTTSQPGWRAGSIGYHGDDGGLFLSSGQSTRRLEPFSAESSLPGCQVRCQLKPVSGRLRCIFSLDRRGVGDFVEVSSEPVEPPAGGFFACLVDSAAWRPAAAETSAAVAGAVGSEDSGQEREPFDSVRYQLASVWPQLELPCHVQSVGLRGGNRGISGVLSGLLMIELRTSEPTQIRVISSGSVRCHLVTRAASGDSASALSESESSWQSLLEMLGSIEEKRAPQFQGKGGGGKAAALTFKKKGGGGKGEQKEQEDEANSDADEDDKAERELVVNASRKDGQRFVCIRVLAPLHGAAAARAAASGQVSEMAEADKSLKGHDTVEVVVSGYGESQQRHKVQLRLLTPSELAAAGSQHQRRLFAVPFTEENARQAGGPCDLLEVLDSGGVTGFATLRTATRRPGAVRVTEVDDKEVSIKSLSVLNASATKVKLDSANLESPQLADLVSMS